MTGGGAHRLQSVSLLAQELDALLRALYPPRCLVCEEPGWAVCGRHLWTLEARPQRCPRCAARISPLLSATRACARCQERSSGLAGAHVLGDYGAGAPLRDWILALKHGGRRDLARPLGEGLARLLGQATADPCPLLVPVPSHPLRRMERGYDPAWLLAREAARALPGARARRLLRRRRDTTPQGEPGARSRAANVRGAFRARPWAGDLSGREVWLVDDVWTSGATLRECARALGRCGARRVGGLVVARATS